MTYYLDFERPIEDLEMKITELKRISDDGENDIGKEIRQLEKDEKELRAKIFSNLTPWQKTLVARHPERPYTLDYIGMIAEDFIELHGDRRYADDPAVVGGTGLVKGIPMMLIGHQKGRGTKERIIRNFGQPNPDGYRKALRLMKLAERFRMPVVTFIDTPGAFPGIGAEERGQAEAIAVNLMEQSRMKVPIISFVIGEGGSGGALALSVCDCLFMLEHSIYSVISPEGCAAILWKREGGQMTQDDFARAASALRLTAQDLIQYGVIDDIIPEPPGGVHRAPEDVAEKILDRITTSLQTLRSLTLPELLDRRYRKIRAIGSYAITTEENHETDVPGGKSFSFSHRHQTFER